jgi:flavin-dependent thymidylate synthase
MKNKNTVELIGWYGNDLTIAQSAWTSTSRELSSEKIDRHAKLIVDLWASGHETPYEKATVHFLVNTDIATHIHLLKHRISSLNAESARYKELKEDKSYLPEDWKNTFVNMSAEECRKFPYEGIEIIDYSSGSWYDVLDRYTEIGNALYHQCLKDLTPVLGRKRAKESARFFKTYNSQIQADVSFNLRSFANFLRLRNSPHAQLEIREVAQQMFSLIEKEENQPFKTALWVINRANELYVEAQEKIKEQIQIEFTEKNK